jgi:hypothetical protein
MRPLDLKRSLNEKKLFAEQRVGLCGLRRLKSFDGVFEIANTSTKKGNLFV